MAFVPVDGLITPYRAYYVKVITPKFRASGTNENSETLSHFHSILKRFRDLSSVANSYLREILSEIDWATDTFELVFLTFGKLDGQARTVSSQLPAYPKGVEDLEGRCEWKFLDEEEINVELRSARNLLRGLSSRFVTLYPIGEKGKRGASSVIEIESGGYSSFIMSLDARQLIKIYEDLDRDAIFSLNIRNYIGNTSTNKEMINCAESEPENFFLYNNGVSCLASRVDVLDHGVTVHGLQVINGAQTVKSLVTVERKHKRNRTSIWLNPEKTPKILVRITEIPEPSGPVKIRENITQYNNTQNTIKISDFRSNDDVQENLKEQFSDIFRGGKRVVYLPKRTDKIPPNSEVIRMEEFTKSVYAFLYDPTAFSGASSFLFNTEKGGGYTQVFGDGSVTWSRMPSDEFKLRAGIYWLAQEFARRIRIARESEVDPDVKAALERKWLVIYAASVVFRKVYGENAWKSRVEKLYKGDWRIDDATGNGATVLKIFEASKSGVITAYKNNKTFNPNFVHRNWMRGKETPDRISDSLQNIILPLVSNIGDIIG